MNKKRAFTNILRLNKKYITMIICTLFICSLVMLLCLKQTQNNLIEDKNFETLEKLNLVGESLNTEIYAAYTNVVRLSGEPEILAINALQSDTFKSSDYIKLNDALKCVKMYHLAEGIIHELILVYENLDMTCITSSRILLDFDMEYSNKLLSINNTTSTEFLDIYVRNEDILKNRYIFYPVSSISICDKKISDVIICSFSTVLQGNKTKPVALLLLNTDKIEEQLAPLIQNGGGSAITDGNGTLLAQFGTPFYSDLPKGGSEQIVKCTDGYRLNTKTSDVAGLDLHIYIPDAWVAENTKPLLSLIIVMLVTAICLTLFMAMISLFYSAGPLSRIINVLSSDKGITTQINSYDAIDCEINKICASNAQLTGTIASWKPVLSAGLLESIYKGGVVSGDELMAVPELMEKLPDEFRCVLVNWKNYPYVDIKCANQAEIVAGLITKYFDSEFMHSCNSRSIAFIVDNRTFSLDVISQLASCLSNAMDMLISIGIGNVSTEIGGIYASYLDAGNAIAGISDYSVERVSIYNDTSRSQDEYSLSLETIQKLVSSINMGDRNTMMGMFEQVYKRIFINRKYSENDIMHFRNDMQLVIDKCSPASKINLSPRSYPAKKLLTSPPAMFDSYNQLFHIMIDSVIQAQETQTNMVFQDIKRYIDENFADSDMSLKLLSEKFGISEKYVSILFKANYHTNFSQYVEDKRLSAAVEHMKNLQLSINDILSRTGYSSPNTFYKAFKRKFGESPTEYRMKINS